MLLKLTSEHRCNSVTSIWYSVTIRAAVATNVISCHVLNLISVPQTWYEVLVQGYNQEGDGGVSQKSIHTLPEDSGESEDGDISGLVEPPTNLEAEPLSSSSIYLTWVPPQISGNISYYTVCYHQVGNTLPVNASAMSYIRRYVFWTLPLSILEGELGFQH